MAEVNSMHFIVVFIFSLALTHACNWSPEPKQVAEQRSLDIVEACEDAEVHNVEKDDQINKISIANAAFFVDLYKSLDSSNNLFISPYSIFSALSLLFAGSSGATKESFEKVLKYNATETDIEAGAKKMLNHFASASNTSEKLAIESANSLFIDSGFNMKERYRARVECFYSSDTSSLSLQQKPEQSRQKINSWVSDKTAGKIKDILPEGSLDSSTQAVLVNALYFSAPWARPFSPSFATKPAPFTLTDGNTITADLMKLGANLPYQTLDGVDIVELAYTSCQGCRNPSQDFSMYIFSPRLATSFQHLESLVLMPDIVTGEGLDLVETALQLELPRFSVSHSESLRPVLDRLGLVMEGGFTRLADQDTSITAVLHKTFLEVDEKGTEAAAATAVFMSRMMFIPDVEMKVDRPFFVSLVHKPSRLLLFAGRITRPDRLQTKP